MMQSVQVIIERLKSHPEDFFGDLQGDRRTYSGSFPKFQDIIDKLDDLLLGRTEHPHRLWYLEPEEQQALLAAYKEARRARFEANVFHTLLTKQELEEKELNVTTRRHPVTGKYMMQGSSSAVTAQSMVEQTTQLIRDEFDKAYAKNSRT